MGARLAHRGGQHQLWSNAERVHLGTLGVRLPRADMPLAFAGFLENRVELLGLCGLAFAGTELHDAELFFALYRRFGIAGIAKIRGQFAAALWDVERRRLLLFCDPIGVRPLYVTYAPGRIAFASEYKALLALSDVPAHADHDALQHLQWTKQLYGAGSMLKGIRPLKPGYCVELGGLEPIEHCYRPLALHVERAPEAHYAELLASALLQAARRQTEGLDNVGLALSAGLDSLVTLGAIRKVAPATHIHTFTVGHSPEDPDLAFARTLAREFGTTHHEIVLNPDALPALLPQVVWHMEDPIGREEMVSWYLVALSAAKHEVSRLFCGNLSDLLFGGMPRFLVVQMAARLPRLSPSLEEFYNCTQNGAPPQSLLGRCFARLYYRNTPLAAPSVIGAVNGREYTRFRSRSAEPLNEILIAGLQGEPNPNATCERLYAAAGLTYTSPFYDLDVIDAAFRIPGTFKIRGRQQKYILRQAARAFVPARLLNRPKGLLRLTRDVRLSAVLHAMAERYLSDARVRARGLFDPAEVRRTCALPTSGLYAEDQLYRLWTLLLTEIWCVTFVDHRGARPERTELAERSEASERDAQPAFTALAKEPAR